MSLSEIIRNYIESNIMSGQWTPGYRLPNEYELAMQFNCARATVNKAMSALANAGLIDRRRKAGSFVALPQLHSAVFDVPDIGAQIAASTGAYYFEALKHLTDAETDVGFKSAWDGPNSSNLRTIVGIHFGKDGPFGYERRLINVDAVPEAKQEQFSRESPGAWLLRKVPWSSAKHRISAIAADRNTASRLFLRSGAPCLQIERWTWRLDIPVTYARQIFPGDRFDLVESFSPRAPQISEK